MPIQLTKQDKALRYERFIGLIKEAREVIDRAVVVWDDELGNDTLAVDHYPFKQSFDELTYALDEWTDALEDVALRLTTPKAYEVELDTTQFDDEFKNDIAQLGVRGARLSRQHNGWNCKYIALTREALVAMIEKWWDDNSGDMSYLTDMIKEVE